ncbi:hypothetical protein DFH09DRAFT_1085212 [Mycena vulgaris]|nr:hypothetical protein DFH09DRAFT_1085212 [Mycena vulgaris]
MYEPHVKQIINHDRQRKEIHGWLFKSWRRTWIQLFGRTGNKQRDGFKALTTHVIIANGLVVQRKQHSLSAAHRHAFSDCVLPLGAIATVAPTSYPARQSTQLRANARWYYQKSVDGAAISSAKSSRTAAKGESEELIPQSQKGNGEKERKERKIRRGHAPQRPLYPSSASPVPSIISAVGMQCLRENVNTWGQQVRRKAGQWGDGRRELGRRERRRSIDGWKEENAPNSSSAMVMASHVARHQRGGTAVHPDHSPVRGWDPPFLQAYQSASRASGAPGGGCRKKEGKHLGKDEQGRSKRRGRTPTWRMEKEGREINHSPLTSGRVLAASELLHDDDVKAIRAPDSQHL